MPRPGRGPKEHSLIRSMTGFGGASSQIGGIHYFLEVRSLNSKYFKAVIRLPEEFQGLEAEMESRLRHRLSRGSVFLTAKCTDASAEAAHEINEKALAHYIEQLKRIPQIAGGQVEVDIGSLLALPGVLQPPADEEQRIERARTAFLALLDQACDRLEAMREHEGKVLLADLLANRDVIAQRLSNIVTRIPAVLAEYERRLRTRIQTMISEAGLALEAIDVVREMAILAERSDTAEEIKRLGAHIDQFTELLGASVGAPIGRTLDFLSQEMLREANTIASKCADAEIARWIVEVKGAIDRIKEQVQNVE